MKSKQKQKARAPQEEPSMASLFKHLTYSLPITVGIFLLLTAAVALALYFLSDPAPFLRPSACLVAALSAFVGGCVLCRKQGESALLCGLVNGSFFLCILLLVSLFFRAHTSGDSPLLSTALHLGVLLCSILGGYAGLPRQKRKKR